MRPHKHSGSLSFRRQPVVIVDDDLGFTLWLGQLLKEAGYQALPAFSCLEAFSHIQQFNAKVGAIIVNPALPGVADMLQMLGSTHGPLRIIFIQNPGIDVPGMLPAHAMLTKPRGWQRISHREWLRKIEKALTDAPPFASKAG